MERHALPQKMLRMFVFMSRMLGLLSKMFAFTCEMFGFSCKKLRRDGLRRGVCVYQKFVSIHCLAQILCEPFRFAMILHDWLEHRMLSHVFGWNSSAD